MCTDKNNHKNKANLLPPSFHSFLNCRKTTKFMTFSLFLLTFREKLSLTA